MNEVGTQKSEGNEAVAPQVTQKPHPQGRSKVGHRGDPGHWFKICTQWTHIFGYEVDSGIFWYWNGHLFLSTYCHMFLADVEVLTCDTFMCCGCNTWAVPVAGGFWVVQI